MNRSLTIQPKDGSLPWRAQPSENTTIEELERAVMMLKLDILRTTDDEILLVQTAEAIRDGVPPPDTQELEMVMFPGYESVTLVEDPGPHRTIDEDEIHVG